MTTSPTTDIQPDYVMVPREPTEAMTSAGTELALNVKLCGDYRWPDYMADLWSAMLSAAPASPIPTSVANEGEREEHIADVGKLVERLRSYAATCTGLGTQRILKDAADRLAALSPALDNTAVEGQDRFANDEAAKALYDTWSNQPGWVPWVERGNSTMQERARREVAL